MLSPEATEQLLPALAATVVGAAILAFVNVHALSRKIATVTLGVSLLLTVAYALIDHFTGRGLDESVLFYVEEGLAGVPVWQHWRLLLAVAVALGAVIVLLRLINLRRTRLLLRDPVPVATPLATLLGPLTLLFGVVFHPLLRDAVVISEMWFYAKAPDVEPFLQAPKYKVHGSPRSFVYIYAEGVEQAFLDDRRFPGLTPGLQRLQQTALRFRGIVDAPFTDWTIAGMVATQCGVPLYDIHRDHVRFDKMPRFLPGAVCVGDILSRHQYQLAYMGGADLDFGAKGRFFREHGFDELYGTRELEELAGRPLRQSTWGIYDDDLFDLALQRFGELSRSKSPFGLVLLTLDTHAPYGHRTPRCEREGISYARESRVLQSVACADYLIAGFIEQILDTVYAQDLVLVVGSDHLILGNDAGLRSDDPSREYWLVVWNSGLEPGVVRRTATAMDVAPTLMRLLGFRSAGHGLGRNLLRDAPTLPERLGKQVFFDHVRGWRFQLSKIWSTEAGGEGSSG